MSVVLGIVLPVIGVMLAGLVAARLGAIDPAGTRGLSIFVFNVVIPALLFRSMAAGAASGASGLGIVYAYFGACLIVFAAAMAAARWRFERPLEQQAVVAMNASFSNSVQLGIPLVFTAFGEAGLRPLLLVIAFHSVTLVSLATILVEAGMGRGRRAGAALLAMLRALAVNPILMAILLGALWRETGLGLPGPFDSFLRLLGDAATPCALFVLGASLARLRLVGALGEVFAIGAVKLLVLPLLTWVLARFMFELPAVETAVATVTAALPTGANAFILAQRYDLYVAESASIVLVTTLASIVTVSALLGVFAAG